ncbi:hypothetical protein ACFLXF_03790, partial [Chloroflexota bacterium]
IAWFGRIRLRELAMTGTGIWDSDSLQEDVFERESDLPPEYCHYKDDGCELATSCLNCPMAQCVYDEPGGKQRQLKRLRDKEIVRLFSQESKGVRELALMFSLSDRTIQRALKNSLRRD